MERTELGKKWTFFDLGERIGHDIPQNKVRLVVAATDDKVATAVDIDGVPKRATGEDAGLVKMVAGLGRNRPSPFVGDADANRLDNLGPAGQMIFDVFFILLEEN